MVTTHVQHRKRAFARSHPILEAHPLKCAKGRTTRPFGAENSHGVGVRLTLAAGQGRIHEVQPAAARAAVWCRAASPRRVDRTNAASRLVEGGRRQQEWDDLVEATGLQAFAGRLPKPIEQCKRQAGLIDAHPGATVGFTREFVPAGLFLQPASCRLQSGRVARRVDPHRQRSRWSRRFRG